VAGGSEPGRCHRRAVAAASERQHLLGKVRAKIKAPVSTLKVLGKVGGMVEGSAELEFQDSDKARVGIVRTAFTAFDKSKNKGLLLIDEAQVLADKSHGSLRAI
jgi:hypothetical protein